MLYFFLDDEEILTSYTSGIESRNLLYLVKVNSFFYIAFIKEKFVYKLEIGG